MSAQPSIGPVAILVLGALALWWLYRRPARRVSGSVSIDTFEIGDQLYIAPRDFTLPTVAPFSLH